jgi:transposase
MSTNPDEVRVHEVECCESCGCSLKHKQPINYGRRQVFDILPIAVEVTEHQAEINEYDQCGAVNTAAFAEGVTHKVQYRDNLYARALYLKNYCLLPYDRAAELFEDFFDIPLSAGRLVTIDNDGGKRLKEVTDRIKELIQNTMLPLLMKQT